MTNHVARIDWAWLLRAVPQDLSGLAKQTGAVARWRKVCSGEVLLWLCMLYTTAALSLRSTSFLSQSTGRCKLNDSSLLHRFFCLGKMIEAALIDRLNNRMVDLSTALADDAVRPSVSLYRLTVVHHLQMLLAVCAGFRVKAERLLCAIGALREGRRKRSDSLSLITQTHRRINTPRFEPPLPVG
jgi:hypothetical protein